MLYVWSVTETNGYESAWVRRTDAGMEADGHAVGQASGSYWLRYRLETDRRLCTTVLRATVSQDGGPDRTTTLKRDDQGWAVDGDPRPDLAGALDIDLYCSPLTNTMPLVREGLHRHRGQAQLTMAFVTVPELKVTAVAQKYEHLGATEAGARVRYSAGTFSSDLEVDGEGFVLRYPRMAVRLPSGG